MVAKTPPKKTPKKLAVHIITPLGRVFTNYRTSFKSYLARRPHRSFVLTRRRDYVRSLQLPGYLGFTNEVRKVLWSQRRLFGFVVLAYTTLNIVFVGLSSQDTYTQLSDILNDTGKEIFAGGWGELGKAGLLLASGISGSFVPELTDVQQVYSLFFLLMTWLTTVWLLRAILSGHTPKLRDGLYNAGAPIISTGLVLLTLLIQLLPLAVAIIGLSAATSTGFLTGGGLIAMLLWFVVALLSVMSLYWVTSTFMALIIVTLPGMYPWQAIKTAGDLVIGRRIRILLRLVWLLMSAALIWLLTVLPIILLDRWLKSQIPAIEWMPIVPITIAVVTSFATIWTSAYIYLLYRKVVEDDADPA